MLLAYAMDPSFALVTMVVNNKCSSKDGGEPGVGGEKERTLEVQ